VLDGQVVGERLFYKNGEVAEERLLENGKLHGVSRQFHENGKLFSERPFRRGSPDGTFRFWDDAGELLGESVLKNGTGVLLQFENRALVLAREEIPFVDGKIHGNRKQWGRFDVTDKNGCSVTRYKKGEMDGWTYVLDGDGMLLAYSYIKHDRLHGVMRKATRGGTNVKGYPKYMIEGTEVSEDRFRVAAKTDPILAMTLTGKPDVDEPTPKTQEGK
jgi:antitoxin component YwqK of YwqJK toxin-antitoxin module